MQLILDTVEHMDQTDVLLLKEIKPITPLNY